MEDCEIVKLYLKRDEKAIGETQNKYGGRLRALALSITYDTQTAEECENDTYLRAWCSIPPNEPREYLYAFLAKITRHLSLDFCRSRKRLKRSAHIVELSDELLQCLPSGREPAQCIDDIVLKEVLDSFLLSLSEEKRNIFIRRYWFLDSIEDISRRYNISQSKVKAVLMRCRTKLRFQLEKEGFSS